jgi:hypothetical protein
MYIQTNNIFLKFLGFTKARLYLVSSKDNIYPEIETEIIFTFLEMVLAT